MGGDGFTVSFRAALLRIGVAVMVLSLQPLIGPGLADERWVILAYIASALFAQLLIWKDVLPWARRVGWGLIDIAFLSFLVHRIGSVETALVAVYIAIGMMNALVGSLRVGMGLALVASLAYSGVLLSEHVGWLPHAPAAAPGAAGELIASSAIAAAVIITLVTLASTALVGTLVRKVREHELQLMDVNTQLEELSTHDSLTQLYNRRYLLDRIDRELARVRRGHDLAVLLVDLDRFKHVNDDQGHIRGDECLVAIAHALGQATRETDVPGRFGGDEFVVILPDTGEASARIVAERLIRNVHEVGAKFDPDLPVTASVGMALATSDDTAVDLLRRADANTYRAKASGGNRLVWEPVTSSDAAVQSNGNRST